MSRHVLVKDIMTRKVICASLKNKLSQVIEFFAKFKIQHLPVTHNDKIVGIISVNDIVSFIHNHLQKSENITQKYLNDTFSLEYLMTKNPATIGPDEPIENAVKLLEPGKFQSVLVAVDGEIKGIITNKDIVRFHANGFDTDTENYIIETPGYGI